MPQYDYDANFTPPERGEHEQLGKFLLDLTPDLNNLRFNWFGLRINPNFGKAMPNGKDVDFRELVHDPNHRIMNEKGANSLFSMTVGALNKVVSVTNVDDDIIRKEVSSFHKNLNETCARNHMKWELDPDNYRMLISNMVNLVVAAWHASKGGMRMKLTLNPAFQREVIQTQSDVVEKKKAPKLGWAFGGEKF